MNDQIWQLWRKAIEQHGTAAVLGRVPKFVLTPESKPNIKDSLLVLGLNPSFVDNRYELPEAFHRWMMSQEIEYPKDLYWEKSAFSQAKDFNAVRSVANKMALMHHESRLYYPKYFGRLNEIADRLDIGIDNFANADMYLWLTAKSGEISNLRQNYCELKEAQECLFFKLAEMIQPKLILCSYSGPGKIFLKLCQQRQLIASALFTPVENVCLAVAYVNFPWRCGVPVFIPRGGTIPQGGRHINQTDYQQVLNHLQEAWRAL